MRVLLVEDEALVAMIAEEALSSMGFEVCSARNGAEALETFERETVVLAVVDVGLPDIRGDELARRLRASAPELAILVASGYDPGELSARFVDDARITVLAKPYTEGDLRRAIVSLGVAVQD